MCDQNIIEDINMIHNDCTICLSSIIGMQCIINLACKHSFHLSCLSEWELKSILCPNCRSVINKNPRYGLPFNTNLKMPPKITYTPLYPRLATSPYAGYIRDNKLLNNKTTSSHKSHTYK